MLFLTTGYSYIKTSVTPINRLYHRKIVIALGCIIQSVFFTSIYPFSIAAAQLIGYFYPSVFFSLFEKQQRSKAFFICFILSSFTRVLLLIPSALVSFALAILNYEGALFFSLIVSYFITFVLAFLLLKVKRFKKGFHFFQSDKKLGVGLLIAGILFLLQGIIYSYDYYQQSITVIIVIFLAFSISGFGLYLWIRRSITAHYRERLQARSEEHFQELIKEKEEENAKLTKSNEFLAKVVHRDNHLMASLDSSINAYFESGNKEFKDDLLRKIQTLAKERGELINKEQRDSKLLPSTGNILIDGAIGDLYIKAIAHGIDFDLTVSETVDEIVGKYISQTELQTLICDHIKDAVIAVDAAGKDNGRILVELSVKNGDYTIAVFDNGVDFDPEILAKLGKERVTTHAENGGSGIGFMATFETLRKAHASLSITEFENKTPFSKSVSFIFNGENSFIIKSYRAEQLKAAINRDNIITL